MSYLENPNCDEWYEFIMDCSLDDGEDVLERIEDAGANRYRLTGDEGVKFSDIRSGVGGSYAGSTYTGTIDIGGKEFSFEYESTNVRGSVVLNWDGQSC